ncbi:hypothetical protein SAMN04488005_1488 [Yoonia tamlensis]|uniref:Uncharacterized protein n=1 Tax=Yoonia tamlensis TaxID=390270 RepID=A0A1I6GDT4_9RHOB|nr:hypothetical protein [Yoonia tamlensis]SFR40373.1 hypothetical protein SAMN04488005_1488 [Yoonia tamlensis]
MSAKKVDEVSVSDRLAEWQQGDFTVDCGEFLFCTSPLDDEDEGAPFSADIEEKHQGICVISQTCDIVRDPERSTISYVTVCPLVKLNAAHNSAIEKGEVPRFGMLVGAPENTVVDFTRAMSVKKDLLVKWNKQRGCPSEVDLQNFARSLERFFGRFGYPDEFNESMETFRKAVNGKYGKPNSEFGKAIRSVSEFRVFPHKPWDNPESVPITILAILKDADEREIDDIESLRRELMDQASKIKWFAPFSPNEVVLRLASLNELSAAEYLNSYPLELNALSFAKRYQAAG